MNNLEFTMFESAIKGVHFECVLRADDIVAISTSLSVQQSISVESFAEVMATKRNCKKMYGNKIGSLCNYNCEPLRLYGEKN